jgi:ectoine hydroxylase-related dioxygenase (phytanoyl-CoA dioxygenase family)
MPSAERASAVPSLPQPTRDVAQLKRDLDLHGYCLVAEALTRDQIARLLDRIQEQARGEQRLLGTTRDPSFVSVDNLLNKGDVFQPLITHGPVGTLIEHLLGEDYLLSLFEARGVGPGHAAQALHSDQNFVPGRAVGPFIANALWMLVDFSEDNGATRIIPGSHLWGDDHPIIQRDQATWAVFSRMMNNLFDLDRRSARAQLSRGARGMLDANPRGTVAAAAPAGTALVINARVIHGAGKNASRDSIRWTILTYYCRPFMRQHTNPFLSLSGDVVRGLPREIRKRLGFRPWALLGRYEDDVGWAEGDHVPGADARIGLLRGEGP